MEQNRFYGIKPISPTNPERMKFPYDTQITSSFQRYPTESSDNDENVRWGVEAPNTWKSAADVGISYENINELSPSDSIPNDLGWHINDHWGSASSDLVLNKLNPTYSNYRYNPPSSCFSVVS